MKIIGFLAALVLTLNAFCQTARPKLAVGIVVDQMCYDYLERFQEHFCENGLKKLIKHGATLNNIHYNYIPTYTGPGHASIYTGTTPKKHGIIANDWIQRSTQSTVNCVSAPEEKGVGSSEGYGASSPHRLKINTITDKLKTIHPESKVISVSIKDRGAILPGGHQSDGTYWFDYGNGTFITSTYFKSELPKWLRNFNQKNNAASYSDIWLPLRNDSVYSASDESPYERILEGKKAAIFPYDVLDLCSKARSLTPFTMSPFANTLLTDLAIKALKKEGLGKDKFPDMLCISYSSTDIAGHAFGPDSKELEDMYIRFDLEIARLIRILEKKIGIDNFVMFLTSDHGVVPVPQKLIDEGLPGGYVFIDEVVRKLRLESISNFGQDFILGQDNLNIYLDWEKIDAPHATANKDQILMILEDNISKIKGVKLIARASEFTKPSKNHDLTKMLGEGFDAERSGDLLIALNHGYLPKSTLSLHPFQGTSHGSGYSYDTHVPCLWYGKGVKNISLNERYDIIDIAPTLLDLLGISKSEDITGKTIKALIKP